MGTWFGGFTGQLHQLNPIPPGYAMHLANDHVLPLFLRTVREMVGRPGSNTPG